mgnify:CR=1 FL=1|jgi:hypothetical protein
MKNEELKKQEVVNDQEEILNPQESAVVEGGNESPESVVSDEKLDLSDLQNIEGGIKENDKIQDLDSGSWGVGCSC